PPASDGGSSMVIATPPLHGGDTELTLSDVAKAVTAGRCLLFLGAGVHAGPSADKPFSYPTASRPPLGGELAQRLADGCDFRREFPHETPPSLQRVALCYEMKHGRDGLVRCLDEEILRAATPSPLLRALAQLPFPLVVTTNYDRLFEKALQAAGKDPDVSVYDKSDETPPTDYPDPTAARPFLFKIHGDIRQPGSIVITDEDYIHFILRMGKERAVPKTVLYRFSTWPTLFIGYSLLDFNLRVLFRTLRFSVDLAPTSYSIDHRPDPLIVSVWGERDRLVRFIAQDVWAIVPELYQRVTGKPLEP
ncbi:MAG: hypothetical protein QOG40_1560, partial [Solirubrobacteraceae bacterium]|nr:hypothetical protein [Solirubrobacteraceae bacterium]